MNIEPRMTPADATEAANAEEKEPKETRRTPVLIYILVLFLAAFLLLGISMLMHQRSSTEANLSAMQQMQATQDRILDLEEELAALRKEADELRANAEASDAAAAERARETDAMIALYALQHKWSERDEDGCKAILQQMADGDLVRHLPTEEVGGVLSPAARYEEIKEAVLNP